MSKFIPTVKIKHGKITFRVTNSVSLSNVSSLLVELAPQARLIVTVELFTSNLTVLGKFSLQHLTSQGTFSIFVSDALIHKVHCH